MAWYSLYKWFSLWRKTPYRNMISWYKKYLFDQWFESLTEEEKHIYRVNQAVQKRNRERKINELIIAGNIISNQLGNHYNTWRDLL